MSSPYEYICAKTLNKEKMHRGQNGKVITKLRNICSNPIEKIDQQRFKEFKYKEDPFDN